MHHSVARLACICVFVAVGAAALAGCSPESADRRPVAWHKIPVPAEALVAIYARLANTACQNTSSETEAPSVFFVELQDEPLRMLQEALADENIIVRGIEPSTELPESRGGNLVDPATGRRAAKLSVGASWMGENRINASAEYYVGVLWAASFRVTIERRSGEWVFTRFERTWVS